MIGDCRSAITPLVPCLLLLARTTRKIVLYLSSAFVRKWKSWGEKRKQPYWRLNWGYHPRWICPCPHLFSPIFSSSIDSVMDRSFRDVSIKIQKLVAVVAVVVEVSESTASHWWWQLVALLAIVAKTVSGGWICRLVSSTTTPFCSSLASRLPLYLPLWSRAFSILFALLYSLQSSCSAISLRIQRHQSVKSRRCSLAFSHLRKSCVAC